jgi:DNA primase
VLCFDGDGAGGRAAARAAELVLPMLAPDRTLRLAALATGEDPDTLVRDSGPGAFQAVLDAARPLSEALYDLLREGHGDATPEQRAAFRTRLEEAARRIPDRALASEYRSALLDRFFRSRTSSRGRGGVAAAPAPAAPPPRRAPSGATAAGERGRILVAILLLHPDLLMDVEDTFRALDLPPSLDRLRIALLDWRDRLHDEALGHVENRAQVLDSTPLMTHLTQIGLDAEAAQVLSAVPYPLPGYASAVAMPAEAEKGWWHIFGLMNRGQLEDEVAAARRSFAERGDEASQLRLIGLCEALRRVEQGSEDDT